MAGRPKKKSKKKPEKTRGLLIPFTPAEVEQIKVYIERSEYFDEVNEWARYLILSTINLKL
jgi:hypothetical protein